MENKIIEKIECTCLFKGEISLKPLISGDLRSGEICIYFKNGQRIDNVEIEWDGDAPSIWDSSQLTNFQVEEVNKYLLENVSVFREKISVIIEQINSTLLTFQIM